MSSRATLSQRFHSNPSINPRTESRIKVGGPTYQSLVAEFGAPMAATSPSRARSSATSPARTSFYSPARAASSSQMGSPSRARSTMSPARVSGRSKSPRRSSSRSKSPARGTIINPLTKRPIQINGAIYDRLAQSGILDGTFVPRTSGRQRFPIRRLAAQPLPRKSPPKAHAKAHSKSPRKTHVKSPRKVHSKSPRKTHVKSPRQVHSKPGHIVNPESGRPIKINGPTYARLSQAGKI